MKQDLAKVFVYLKVTVEGFSRRDIFRVDGSILGYSQFLYAMMIICHKG